MIASRVFPTVDSYTEVMPARVITGGVGPIPSETMLERKLHFERHTDEPRLLLMREPLGHGAMSGAILPAARSAGRLPAAQASGGARGPTRQALRPTWCGIGRR